MFVPARGPGGEIYGVLQRRDPTQRTEVVRLDEGGFVALPLPRPAWLPELAAPEAVSVGDERLAVVWGAAMASRIVVQPPLTSRSTSCWKLAACICACSRIMVG